MSLLIKGGRLIDPCTAVDRITDIYVDDRTITEIGEIQRGADTVIDAAGMTVVPGLVDMHCHLRDPGYEYKEDIESGTKSAAMGGFTSIACMPNTNPVIDNQTVVEYIKSKAKSVGVVNVYPIGAITKGLDGQELSPAGELKSAGAVAISDDGKPVNNSYVMRRALEYSRMFNIPVISHCEDLSLVDDGVMHEGYMSTYLGLKGITPAAEEVMIARDILLSAVTGVPVHIAHVSTKRGVQLIRQAKADQIKVTCETCPHYFTLTDKAVDNYNTFAKMNPPLRTEQDVEAIKQGLRDLTIDAIATDHAPHHADEKNVEFARATNGIVGFETALSLGITYLVDTGVLTLSELISKMSVVPSKILGLDKGSIALGKCADIAIIKPDEQYTVDIKKFRSKSKNSPFNGYNLKGRVWHTIVGGRIVVAESELVVK